MCVVRCCILTKTFLVTRDNEKGNINLPVFLSEMIIYYIFYNYYTRGYMCSRKEVYV